MSSISRGQTRRRITRRTRLELIARAGGRCSFPNCHLMQEEDGLPLLEVARIISLWSVQAGDPRVDLDSPDNLIVLCPSHHRMIDRGEQFSVEWLRRTKTIHERRISENLSRPVSPSPRVVLPAVRNPLVDAVEAWNARTGDESEEFWQQLFVNTPGCFALMLQGRAYQLQGKAYVGGKRVDNKGGNELEFLAVHKANLACVEIKKPTTDLLGASYRGNVRLPSEDLVGGCVQVLESRRSLMQNLDLLNARAEPQDRLIADHPPLCFVIVGDLSREQFTVSERTSFDLFRNSLRDVSVFTFDELFEGIGQVLDVTTSN